MIEAAFGNQGVDAGFNVIATVSSLYKYVEPDRIAGQIIVYSIVPQDGRLPLASPSEPVADFPGMANQTITDLVLEVFADGGTFIRALGTKTIEELSSDAVVYHYRDGRERFLAKAESKTVQRLDAAARSQFSVPSFATLREALQHYGRENVRESTCYIFNNVWADDKRLFLRAKPESTMRNSLVQFLRNRIGADHDVWPEQNVDESHPVDIQVKPKLSNNRLMLIEIKWLGDSVAADGHITASHGEPRAQKGVGQLTQYLEDQRRFAPSNVIHGYYVIIDARRRNLKNGTTEIKRADGMHYETQDIPFNPAPHLTRQDFDPPYRMFARPVCCD
jgi:hypothetical protein